MIHVCRQHVFFNMFCTKRSSQTKNGHNIASTNQPFFKKTQFQRKLCWLHRCYVKKGNHLVGRCYLKKPTNFLPKFQWRQWRHLGLFRTSASLRSKFSIKLRTPRKEVRELKWRLNARAAYRFNTVIIMGCDVTYWNMFFVVSWVFCLV